MSDIAKFLGAWKEHTKPKLLLEIDQKYIDDIQEDIDEAESGTSADMAFNDIFGMPTPDNPRTRIVMPYGNPDVEKLKHLIGTIRLKVINAYRENPNISFVSYADWGVNTNTVTQDVRPLRWREGDPLEKVEKQIGNIVFDITYTSSKGNKAERKETLAFSTLLKKYAPEQFDWWQGVKGQQGKYTFFNQNPELLQDVLEDVEQHLSAYSKPYLKTDNNQGRVIIASRHPIDVLRMSDFHSTGISSCHAPGGSHFNNCKYEAKLTSRGGGVLFSMDADKFNAVFPGGEIPQKGDVFSDTDRDIRDALPAPDARLRLRRVINTYNDTEFAIPDKKIYPSHGDPELVRASFSYFAEKQKDKFQEDGKFAFPEPKSLIRYGGSYEDSGDSTVGANFIQFMDTVIKITGRESQIQSDSYLKGTLPWYSRAAYEQLKTSLMSTSIKWGGSLQEEEELDDDPDPCADLEQEAQRINGANLNYFSFFATTECDNDPPYVILNAQATVYFKYDELEDWFSGEVAGGRGSLYKYGEQIRRNLKANDPLSDVCGISIEYPDLEFEDVMIDQSDNKQYAIQVVVSYTGTTTEANDIENKYNDISRFEDKATQLAMKEAIRLAMMDLGLAKTSAYEGMKEEIYSFADWVESSHKNFTVTEEKNSMEFKFSKLLAKEYVLQLANEKLKQDIQSNNKQIREAITDEFLYEFKNAFNNRAKRYKEEVARQLPLFHGIGASETDNLASQQWPDWKPDLKISTDYSGGFPATPEKQTVEFVFSLNIILNTSQIEEELNKSMRYIKEIVDDEDIILHIANDSLVKIMAPGYSSLSEQKKKKITIQEAKEMRKKLKEWMKNRQGVK